LIDADRKTYKNNVLTVGNRCFYRYFYSFSVFLFLSTINGNNISLVVFYEVPIGQRDEIKRKFANLIRSQMAIQRNNY